MLTFQFKQDVDLSSCTAGCCCRDVTVSITTCKWHNIRSTPRQRCMHTYWWSA